MEGSGANCMHVPDAEGSDDGGFMHESDAQGATNAAGGALNMSCVSEDEVSGSEGPLPIKRRSTAEAEKQQRAAAGKAARAGPQSGGASPLDAGDEFESDVESPMTAAGSRPLKKQLHTKKRSKAQLDGEAVPSASPGVELASTITCKASHRGVYCILILYTGIGGRFLNKKSPVDIRSCELYP